jgi:hypothetical protein
MPRIIYHSYLVVQALQRAFVKCHSQRRRQDRALKAFTHRETAYELHALDGVMMGDSRENLESRDHLHK